jgi:hypothetical protein
MPCARAHYGVSILDDHTLIPREIDMTETEGESAYILFGRHDSEEVSSPVEWYKKGDKELRENRKSSAPRLATYCPSCNKIDDNCECSEKIHVTVIQHPFLFCPSCGVYYDRRPREFNKLFTFGSVGRSTATDILVTNMVSSLHERARALEPMEH